MRAAPSMLKRRSTALTSPLCDRKPRLWAMSTLVATAACGGVRKNKSWATPSRNMSCTVAARGAKGMLRQSAIKFVHRRIVFDRVIERPLAAEHHTDQVQRNASRGRRLGHQGSYFQW